LARLVHSEGQLHRSTLPGRLAEIAALLAHPEQDLPAVDNVGQSGVAGAAVLESGNRPSGRELEMLRFMARSSSSADRKRSGGVSARRNFSSADAQ
jgi:hypothetical protein